MTYNWYKIFNKAEFEATGLVSREVQLALEGIGIATFLITQGNLLSLTYNGVMLSIGVTDANPFAFDSNAIYLDANDDVWWGFEIED